MSLRTDSPLIEPDVIARVLAKGRSTGAEFSEIYVEDKRSTSAGLDDGKVEQVTSGRDRGAGIRVIAGDTTGFAHTSDLSERGLLAAAEAAAALKLSAPDLMAMGLVDGVIPEPLGGAHCDPEAAATNLKTSVTQELKTLMKVPIDELLAARYEKFRAMGVFEE